MQLNTDSIRMTLMQQIIRQYISKSTWEKADFLSGEGRLHIEEEELEITCLFADIVSFTRISENLKPKAVIARLNIFFEPAAAAVYANEGDIDKFMGDAFLAIFKDPDQAVQAAIEIQKERGAPKGLRLRIGINTGKVIRGNVGGDLRKDNTIIGDVVNTASRIESHSGAGKILISEDTAKKLKKKYRLSGPLTIEAKGKQLPITVRWLQSGKSTGKSRKKKY